MGETKPHHMDSVPLSVKPVQRIPQVAYVSHDFSWYCPSKTYSYSIRALPCPMVFLSIIESGTEPTYVPSSCTLPSRNQFPALYWWRTPSPFWTAYVMDQSSPYRTIPSLRATPWEAMFAQDVL